MIIFLFLENLITWQLWDQLPKPLCKIKMYYGALLYFHLLWQKNNICSLIITDLILGAYKVYQNEHNSPRIPNLLLIISFHCNCSIPPLNEGMYTCLINFQPLSRPCAGCVFHLIFIGVLLSSEGSLYECYLYSAAPKNTWVGTTHCSFMDCLRTDQTYL